MVILSLQALTNSTVVYENLESEVSALHDDLWEQLNLDIQVKGGSPEHGGGQGVVCISPCPLWQRRAEWLPFSI